MRATIEDLEALKELNDELEENHMENEKQMQAEIDHKDMLVREYVKRLEIADEANADYENTINQFRELVCNLQSDLEQLRQKEESQYSESKNLSSQSRAMLNLNFQLQSTVLKAQAKQIDLELRKLDAAQALENLAFVQPYLPDNFFQTDNDSIRCLLLWKRLVFKSDLIIKQMDQVHNVTEKLNTVVPEELISVCVKIEEMRATIDDLEALKELNDELEESHIETEKQLQSEIEQKEILISEYVRRIEAADEANADYENTINQFRELVANLQSDLEQLRQKEESQSEMRATIDDLEALKELNDELEESHIETEKQLQSEIEQKEILISEYVRRIEAADEANADYENTINQFRELVANLQSDLEQLRQKEESQSEMRATIDDLEALKELNDELEESHIETEKQLQSEIEQKEILISEYVRRIEAADEANADYENTINQFQEITFTFTTETIQRVFSSPELLLHIFSFLPVPTLINNCRLVSRFWYRVVNIPPKIIAYINSLKKAKIYILMESTICDYSTSVSIVGAYANKTRATNQLIRNHIDGVIGHAYEYSPDGYYTCDLNDDHKVRSTGRKDKEGQQSLSSSSRDESNNVRNKSYSLVGNSNRKKSIR
ncbi:9613_t:CDS:10 [Entrophospora sp. SA101]|nr:9613_t:CDS:10 [Entrophospora sp. SA101]